MRNDDGKKCFYIVIYSVLDSKSTFDAAFIQGFSPVLPVPNTDWYFLSLV